MSTNYDDTAMPFAKRHEEWFAILGQRLTNAEQRIERLEKALGLAIGALIGLAIKHAFG